MSSSHGEPAHRRLIRFPRTILEQMIEHANRDRRIECCGLLAGTSDQVTSIYQLRNESPTPHRSYRVALGLFIPFKTMREQGEDLLGIYHSHPHSAAVPSKRDLRQNHYGDVTHVIISLENELPNVRAYRLFPDRFEEVQWVLTDESSQSGEPVS